MKTHEPDLVFAPFRVTSWIVLVRAEESGNQIKLARYPKYSSLQNLIFGYDVSFKRSFNILHGI
jgi:hypothetical protein